MTPDLDSDEFVSIPDVAIFCANSKTDIPVTDADVETIVRVNNDLVAAGEIPVIHVGHNTNKHDEKPILGYFSNFTSGLRDGVATVFARLSVFKDQKAELKKYPRRSAEVRLDPEWGDRRWKIPSLALIGSHEPKLNLGLVHFAQEGSPPLSFFSIEQSAPMVSDELKAQILEVLALTDVFAWAHEQMKSADMKGATGSDEDRGNEKPGDESKGDEAQANDDSARESEGEEAMDEKDKEKFSVMEKELAELRGKLRRAEREKKLSVLEDTGAMFSVQEELDDTDELSDELFDKHVKRLERTAPRAPVNQHFSVAVPNAGGDPAKRGPDPRKIQEHARLHNIPFEAAAAALGV